MHSIKFFLLVFIVLIVGCVGSGDGLSDNGQPVEEQEGSNEEVSGEDEVVTLTQLQNEIFSPICAPCHAGAAAPQGLRLDSEENSYTHLVGIDANEVPELKLVNPEEPELSYLIHKVEGRNTIVGQQMPLGGPALNQQQIKSLRTWIQGGAVQANNSVDATRVTQVSLSKEKRMVRVVIQFSRPLDPHSISKEGIEMELLADQTEELIQPADLVIQKNKMDMIFYPDSATAISKSLRLGVNNSGLLYDLNGRVIDGSAASAEGGVYEYQF